MGNEGNIFNGVEKGAGLSTPTPPHLTVIPSVKCLNYSYDIVNAHHYYPHLKVEAGDNWCKYFFERSLFTLNLNDLAYRAGLLVVTFVCKWLCF